MCGIFGIFNVEQAQKYAFYGIYALQHRGQESVGIAVSDYEKINVVKKTGLVLESISPKDMETLNGNIAIAHVRYSTAGDLGSANAQPLLRKTSLGPVALVHNGNLVNYNTLKAQLQEKGINLYHTSDSELLLALLDAEEYVPEHIRLHPEDTTLLPKVFYALSKVKGAYSVIYMFKDRLVVARDAFGFRPLLVGRLKNALLFASESCSFDILGAQLWREVKPGEVIVVDKKGIRSYQLFQQEKKAMCIFEFVYFSKPESYLFGDWVYKVRKAMGIALAKEDDIIADIVVPVPDSGLVPAIGYSQQKGIPLELGIIRNHYVGRSFIEPTQELRDIKVLMKLNPNRAVLEGKRVVVIDDSLVRGTTSKKIVSMLRRAGAKEVHLRIASPPVVGPCYYGIDTPTKEELIANRFTKEEIQKFIGADSLKYLSLEGLRGCVKDANEFCDACFSGVYPVAYEDTALRIR
ncbi:amidophosphoribosyltransferase [Hydrogenobacter hydrogenophilus]|uniref:Amidophosphoribosyltransferase n=1 Tax=Hydrogenobacter hydrogenophilus TaxID=35835 RepID=A0A285NWE3_9AQUI|nr:amidophosphoribosyltransferase [Hydrogenobacter hydrogenophilus]SNZ13253.1 amidophosphoribosyltransferase [Hydrogenobacter hydrogenophilus]